MVIGAPAPPRRSVDVSIEDEYTPLRIRA